MSNIITLSRQFGSGGREVAKRLADALDFAYYDGEFIDAVAEKTGLCKEFVEKYSERNLSRNYPFTFGRTFGTSIQSPTEQVHLEQFKLLEEFAKSDCVIVGRGADYLLRAQNPFKIFIYASDMNFRIQRCYDKVPEDRSKGENAMRKQILEVDKDRSKYYDYITGQKWGEMVNYNLCIDTSVFGVKKTVETIVSAMRTK